MAAGLERSRPGSSGGPLPCRPARGVGRGARALTGQPRHCARAASARGPARSGPVAEARTELKAFATAPFPYDGKVPRTNARFLDTVMDGRRGHRSSRGRVFWEETYSDARVLLHIPEKFDARRPAVMIVFFHGHGATLERDVRDRQRVPEQISHSGANAVLVAPQFAVDAPDRARASSGSRAPAGGSSTRPPSSSPECTASRARRERSRRCPSWSWPTAAGTCRPRGASRRRRAGGRACAASSCSTRSTESSRRSRPGSPIRDPVLVSAYTRSTGGNHTQLARMLAARNVTVESDLAQALRRGGTSRCSRRGQSGHRDFVTYAWAERPISDLLARLREYPR